jgi:nucleotide-binding universal stress UspA family protein
MIRSVVVALERGAASEVALRCAVRVARWHDARLLMLASVQPEGPPGSERAEADLAFEDDAVLENDEPAPQPAASVTDHPLVEAAATLCGRHRVAWRAEGCVGDPRRHLARYVPRADVVTVSRHRARAARGELPRHAFALLRASARVVLVTPETYQEPQVILAPYDGSPPAARALALAAETSVRADLPLSVASVGSDGFTTAHLNEAKRYLAAYAARADFLSRSGDPVQQLTALTYELGAALLVMGAYGRRPLQRFLGGSRTQRILQGCHGPVLAVR